MFNSGKINVFPSLTSFSLIIFHYVFYHLNDTYFTFTLTHPNVSAFYISIISVYRMKVEQFVFVDQL